MTNQTEEKPHFVLVPLLAQGHMIPMIDMACLLASHGAIVTLITTPVNAARVSTLIDRVEQLGLSIRFLSLPFPTFEFGLPEGAENIDMLPSYELLPNFFDAARTLCDPLLLHLQSCKPVPNCIISDNSNYWTREIAREFDIPRLVFHPFGCFPLLCLLNIRSTKIDEEMKDENEAFIVPGLPSKIEMTRAQMPGFFTIPGMDKFRGEMREAEMASDGVVLNSFGDLEPLYHELYEKVTGKKVWTIGPLSLSNSNVVDMGTRGNKASINEDKCLKWLDSMKPNSVIYASFGSLARTNTWQLIEIGSGLEASNSPFIWVIKAGERLSEVEKWLSEVEKWLSEFEERTRPRGLTIRGWAPQAMILLHSAVGGFMTHCGWNSALESISAGCPMITWPHFGEQFFNERLIVQVLRIGVAVGVKVRTPWAMETSKVLVSKDDVEKAVRSLIDEGEEAEERRKRAKELGEKARKAVLEQGGCSYLNLIELIQHINADSFTG